ncbi:hypothetical protein [Mastigocladopsis repens]|uniref:hypothetical protein n=1 Tax=Mastigocladopsis repens TaxID=221287 RepID=UPI00036872A2|nr:hypothetical protein [Mastigocladopsis repens]
MNSFSSLRVQGEQNYISKQQPPLASPASINFLRLFVEDTSLVSEFSQIWVVCEFQLGDDFNTYNPNKEFDGWT